MGLGYSSRYLYVRFRMMLHRRVVVLRAVWVRRKGLRDFYLESSLGFYLDCIKEVEY